MMFSVLQRSDGPERFILPHGAEKPLGEAFERLGRGGPAAWSDLQAILKMVVALEGELKSPTAARQMLAALHRAPAAIALIRAHRGGLTEQTRRQFERWGAQQAVKRAPTESRHAPAGAMKLKELLGGPGRPGERTAPLAASRRAVNGATGPARRRFALDG